MGFPAYTKEHMLDFAKTFSKWGKDMEYLLKIPYAPNTKYTNISRALSYFIYQNYSIGNQRFYGVESRKKFYKTYVHKKPEPQRTIMRIMSVAYEDLPLFAGLDDTYQGVPVTQAVSWRLKNKI